MARPPLRRHHGFTYLSVIILVAIIGLVSAATLKMGAVIQRSKAEEQLLDIGAAFSDALQSYADATPAGMPPQPPSLKELLKDPRSTNVRRHLRQIYPDPMTGKAEWGIVYLGDKVGVLAVYSLSDAKPVKIGNFPQPFVGMEGKQKISEWRFAATGKPGAPGSASPAAQPQMPATGAPAAPGQTPAAGLAPPVEPLPVPESPLEQPPPSPQVEPAPVEAPQPSPPAEPPAEDPKND
jgi:type II secretory pathway pseudopilin PulG